MSVCLVSVCQTVFEMDGLPIGGLESKCAACITLGGQERRWKCSNEIRARAGFYSKCSWNRGVCHIRYIDDVILVSRMFCRQCLVDSLSVIYNVPFDVSDDGLCIKWLDMSLDLNTCCLGLNIKQLALPPHWSVSKTFFRNILLGRFKRWSPAGVRLSPSLQSGKVQSYVCFWKQDSPDGLVHMLPYSQSMILRLLPMSFLLNVLGTWNTIKKEVPPDKAQ